MRTWCSLLLFAAGCAGGLGPSLEADADPMLQTLPADAWLVGSGAYDETVASPWGGLLVDRGMDLDAVRVDRVVLGCLPKSGCLALLEGDHLQDPDQTGAWAWRRLDVDKAVAGEPAAIRAVARSERQIRRHDRRGAADRPATLTPAQIADEVPDGVAWMWTRDVQRLSTHLATVSPGLGAWLAPTAPHVEGAALSVAAQGDLRVRIRCASENDARLARAAARQGLDRLGDKPGTLGVLAASSTVAREADRVEVRVPARPSDWETLAREVQDQ